MEEHHVVIVVIEPPTRFQTTRLRRLRQTPPTERSPSYYVEEEGEQVCITPNTATWFHWLDGLSHFAFEGLEGDFTARKLPTNKPEEPAHWIAFQKWAEREYRRDLGATDQLTTFHLEAVAADLEDEVATREIG